MDFEQNGKCFLRHRLAAGETPEALSARYTLPICMLLRANPNAHWGAGGQVRIPPPDWCRRCAATREGTEDPVFQIRRYTVRSGERLFGIAEKFGTSMRAILLENGLSSPAQICAGMSLRVPCPGAGFLVYAYHMGDTPEGVAARFGMRVTELLRWNSVEGGIYPGMQLVVRAGGAAEGEADAE